jgi:hypothetical protein
MRIIAVLVALAISGCTGSIATPPPAVTASAQIIQSMAEGKALGSLPLALPKRLTYVDAAYFTGSRGELGSLRAWLLRQGVPLTDDQKTAEIIIEPTSGVDSFNALGTFVGIPALTFGPALGSPLVSFYSKTTDIALAQVSLAAFDAKTGQPIALESSRYGVQAYRVTQAMFLGVSDSPHLLEPQLAR